MELNKINNILILTQLYPADDIPKEATPVVHYFTKEWVKMGKNVRVVHYPSNFPKFLCFIANLFKPLIESKVGHIIRTSQLHELEYNLDEVSVYRVPMMKGKPHASYSREEINKAIEKTINWCYRDNFIPDVIIGHWVNPQLEIINGLKKIFNKPTALIMHDAGTDFRSIYKNDYVQLMSNIDVVGFRSDAIKRKYEASFGVCKKSFYCYSGIPEYFIDEENHNKTLECITSFLFVGTLIERKYPFQILKALLISNLKDVFKLNYIGAGKEGKKIEDSVSNDEDLRNRVHLLGRLPREQVKQELNKADVFVMISRSETFGLVYLEAMAAGCITIASRDEGFDGIIIDGYNGFLCEAGNEKELAKIINRINDMPSHERKLISDNAIATAHNMTDKKVASKYLTDLNNLINI